MLEEERKYEVDDGFVLPDLTAACPTAAGHRALPPLTLRATYYDTADLRLARAGASLRHRRGDDAAVDGEAADRRPGVRHEISSPGRPASRRRTLVDLVTAYTRGAAAGAGDGAAHRPPGLRAAATATTGARRGGRRRGQRARRAPGRAEVPRDRGGAQGRRPRSCSTGSRRCCARPARRAATFTPKHVRALGAAAAAPTGPGRRRPGCPASRAPARWSPRRSARDIAPASSAHDPLVRLRAPGRPATTPPCTRCGSAAAGCAATCAPSHRCWTADWAGPLRAELRLAGRRARRGPRRRGAAGPAAHAPPPPTRWRRSTRRAVARHRRRPRRPARGRRCRPLDEALRCAALPGPAGHAARRGPRAPARRAGRPTPAATVLPAPGGAALAAAGLGGSGVDGAGSWTARRRTTRWHAVRDQRQAGPVRGRRGGRRSLGGEAAALATRPRQGAGPARRAPGRGGRRRHLAGDRRTPTRTTTRSRSPPGGSTSGNARSVAPDARPRSRPPGSRATRRRPDRVGCRDTASGRRAGWSGGRPPTAYADLRGAPAPLRRLVAAQGQAGAGRARAGRGGPRGRRGDRRAGRAAGAAAVGAVPQRGAAQAGRLLVDARGGQRRFPTGHRGGRHPLARRSTTRSGWSATRTTPRCWRRSPRCRR